MLSFFYLVHLHAMLLPLPTPCFQLNTNTSTLPFAPFSQAAAGKESAEYLQLMEQAVQLQQLSAANADLNARLDSLGDRQLELRWVGLGVLGLTCGV